MKSISTIWDAVRRRIAPPMPEPPPEIVEPPAEPSPAVEGKGRPPKAAPPDAAECERRIIAHFHPTLVLDVGAANGNYATALRTSGYAQRICSFEPRSEALALLRVAVERDPLWECYPFALGDTDSTATIHISQNRYSSSILPIDPFCVEAEAKTVTIGSEEISVRTLDSVWDEIAPKPDDRILLKIDVQGFEGSVLDGARESLRHIGALHIELSLQRLYRDAPLAEELIARLRAYGFTPVSINNAFMDARTSHLLQVDVIFLRLDSL